MPNLANVLIDHVDARRRRTKHSVRSSTVDFRVESLIENRFALNGYIGDFAESGVSTAREAQEEPESARAGA